MNNKALHYFGYLVCVVIFAAAILVLYRELQHLSVNHISSAIHAVPVSKIFWIILLTIADYLLLTGYDRLGLYYLKRDIPYPRIALASFVGYVFSHNMTFFGGSTARYRLYSVLSVPGYDITKLILFCGMTFWLGIFTLTGAVFVLNSPVLPDSIPVSLFSLKLIGLLFLLVPLFYLILTAIHKNTFHVREWEITLPSLPIACTQIAMAVCDLLLAVTILYILFPAGSEITYFSFIGIYVFALTAGLISHVPGGLGVFDSAIILLLKPLIPASEILGALLLYRLFYYLIPFALATVFVAVHESLQHQERLKRFGYYAGKLVSAIAPEILTISVAAAGIILLFSGSLPAIHGRMHFLQTFLPLPAIELSHFMGSLVGAALLMLSRSIQRRVNASYPILILLLCLGILFSLLKGLDYEEAAVLTVILLLFLPCRRLFYRKAALLTRRFTPGWVALVASVFMALAWLGFFVYRHMEYRHELWWEFALQSDAPRFLRALAGTAVLIILFAIAELLKPAVHPRGVTASVSFSAIESIVNEYPKTYANLALLGDKQFLISSTQKTFLMYAIEGRSWIVLGDPVGPESEWEELLWDFRELCDQHGGWPVFYQIDKGSLDYYLDLGMSFFKLGEEARVPLEQFSLEGPSRRDLRYSHRKVQKENISFAIIPRQDVPSIINQLKSVSDTWLAVKRGIEKKFSLGSFSTDYICCFPIAVVYHGREIIGFSNIWLGANKEELSVDLMRHTPSSPNGIMDYLFVELMLWGKAQGYRYFNLGMAPMSGMEDRRMAPLWQKMGFFLFRHGDHFYNFQGLRKYKEKFLPEWSAKYLACPRGFALPRVLTNLTVLVSGSGVKRKNS